MTDDGFSDREKVLLDVIGIYNVVDLKSIWYELLEIIKEKDEALSST